VEDDGSVNSIDVSAENLGTGEIETYRSRNLAVALGGTPIIPEAVHRRRGARAFHSSECLYRLKDTFEDIRAAHEFVVVGSGQTAADILHHLIRTYPNAKISLCMREFAFKPQDDTHFVNELFFPETTDMFFDMREPNRRALLAKHKDVTHSAVDVDLLPLIYDAIYQDNVSGRHRLTIQRFFELESAEESEDSVSAIFRNHARECSVEIRCDALIMATGYDRNAPLDILDELRPFLASDRNGQFQVERNYNIKRLPGFRPKIYLEGYCEATHGFSEILLSLLPIRSAQIINDMFTDEVGLADMELSRPKWGKGIERK
jgi:L-ornithine N5-oxygenase